MKMRHSIALFSVLLATIPNLVNAGMCAAWFDAKAVDAVKKCCTDLSGDWNPVSHKEAACLFPDEDIEAWQACAKPLMTNPNKLPYSLHSWQCSECDVCTVTGGPTLTVPATKTPTPSSTAAAPIMYDLRQTVELTQC
jgi:hypothetical protein